MNRPLVPIRTATSSNNSLINMMCWPSLTDMASPKEYSCNKERGGGGWVPIGHVDGEERGGLSAYRTRGRRGEGGDGSLSNLSPRMDAGIAF